MSHASRERGFSLVEMLAALIIFSLGVMAVLEVITTSVRSTTATVGYTEAVFLAQQRIEETIATEALAPKTDSGDFGEAYPRHAWKREVEELDPGQLYRIRVDVTWNERGSERQYTLTTLSANRQ
ncbi:MAG: prepilin-type N-terminal cleavage/methylation domain-containing protein [Candidatus Brocadiia bacterium]